ncbi:MAG: NADH-quinone oxidoreductase subunit H [Thermogutta sp.]|nr:NADH-quinone oxidoreductase subunit H [Thermogutta sp.]
MIALCVTALIKIFIIIAALMTAAAYLVLVERWVAAWVQDRLGPNRAGIPLTNIRLWGLGQPIADGVKLIFKEEFVPGHVDKILYTLAPIATFTAAVLIYAVFPFGSLEWTSDRPPIPLGLVPGFDAGLLFIFAVNGVAVYGVILGGWAGNNKYSLFGALRGAAQLIAYEIPLSLAVLALVLAAGSLRVEDVVAQQAHGGVWNVFLHPLAFIVFFVAVTAEAARLPFDLPETEQELVGGYHTEYSGIRLMMYLVSEFLHMITASFLIVILFLGGWHFWGLTGAEEAAPWPIAVLRVAVLLAKVLAVVFFFMLIRWTWLRFRFDQLLALAWQVMVPWGLAQLVFLAFWLEYVQDDPWSGGWVTAWPMAAVNWGLLVAVWFVTALVAAPHYDNRPRRITLPPRRTVVPEADAAVVPQGPRGA